MEVVIGDRIVGPGHPCFITFEIGPTHNGIESAKRLVSHSRGRCRRCKISDA